MRERLERGAKLGEALIDRIRRLEERVKRLEEAREVSHDWPKSLEDHPRL